MKLYSNNIAPELEQKSKIFAIVSLTLIPLTLTGVISAYFSPEGNKMTMLFMALTTGLFFISFILNREGKYNIAGDLLIYSCVVLPIVVLFFKEHDPESVFSTLTMIILPSLLGSVFYSVKKIVVLVLFSLSMPFLLLIVTNDITFYSIFKVIGGLYFPMAVLIIIITAVNNTYMSKILSQSVIISDSLNEKKILLKEIHHRVKNNLQVITSLLSLQVGFIDDERTKVIFSNSQFRINSMAMVHEMLYQNENLSKINLKHYIQELSNYILASFRDERNNVKIEIDSQDLFFNIDTSIPLGLLINEIITNSLKYGLQEHGVISIKLTPLEYPDFLLEIGDNGVGFSGNYFHSSKTLGLQLIHKLTRQLNGKIEKDNSKKGTFYIIHFQEIVQKS